MIKYNHEKKEYVEITEKAMNAVEKVITINSKQTFLSDNQRKILSDLFSLVSNINRKISSETFEVAIIGLEKAGKSTFANALIKNNVLPCESTRCTFTSTRLEYGNNTATVEFIDKNQLDNDFKDLLKMVDFPNSQELTVDSLSEKDIDNYFSLLEIRNPQLHHAYSGRVDQDIKAYITGKKEINEFCGKAPENFKNEELKLQKFKRFITDPSISRTVANVKIYSKELSEMKNAIIFDVPGFDSPTNIHEEQTLEKLKNSDVIIMVTNVGDTPNIKGPQLNLLKRESDFDGIKLNEKMFIFGNKVDRANDFASAKNNIETLIKESTEKYNLVKKDRIFIGSAKAYLEEMKIDETIVASKIMKDLNLPNSIDETRIALEKFYKEERFTVLKVRANNAIQRIKEHLSKIVKENFSESNLQRIRMRNIETTFDLHEKSEIIKGKIENLRKNLKENEASIKQSFEKIIKEGVSLKIRDTTIEAINNTITRVDTDLHGTPFPAVLVNISLRQEIYINYLEQFSGIIVNVTDGKIEELEREIILIFRQSLGIDESNEHFSKINDELMILIENLKGDSKFSRQSFIPLIERFSGVVFDLLLNKPLGSPDRKNKLLDSIQDFAALSAFFDIESLNKPFMEQPLTKLILRQEDSSDNETAVTSIQDKLVENFEKYNIFDTSNKSNMDFVNDLISKSHIPRFQENIFLKEIESRFKIINEHRCDRQGEDEEILKKYIAKKFNDIICELNKEDESGYSKNENYMKPIEVVMSGTPEALVNEINTDIKNLKIILEKAVVNAIGIEKAFLSSFNKQTNLIIAKLNKQNRPFRDFITNNAHLISCEKFRDNELEISKLETLKHIGEEVNSLISQLG